MTLLWCDGFDHYGTDEAVMEDGVYTIGTAGFSLDTSIFATGTTSIHIAGSGGAVEARGPRWVLPSSTDKMGVMARLYFSGLPDNGTTGVGATPFAFMTSDSLTSHVSCIVDPQGAIRFYRGCDMKPGLSTGTLIAQTDPVLVPNAFNHVEIQCAIHNTLGWVRVAVNGVHRYAATGLDTRQGTDTDIYSVRNIITSASSSSSNDFYMDDMIYYNFSGTAAVDTDWCPTVDGSGIATNYMGEYQCMYLPPVADTAEDDWTASTGVSSAAMVDETAPNDADYISSVTAGDLTEMTLTDLPEEITYVRGLQLIGRMSKSDAGSAMTKFGMKSVAATSDAAERPLTVVPTYWWDFINVDPNSSARWTRASLNAAWIRLTRSA